MEILYYLHINLDLGLKELLRLSRAAMVQALRALVAATPGLSWSTDTAPDIAELVQDQKLSRVERHASHFQVRQTSTDLMSSSYSILNRFAFYNHTLTTSDCLSFAAAISR